MQWGVSSPTAVQWCRAPGPLHPATHPRLHLCDLHHLEYRRAHGAWRSRVNYRKANPSAPDPGTWEEAEARIRYTRVDAVYTALNPEDRAFSRMLADKIEGLATRLRPFVVGDAYFNVDIEDFRIIIGTVQQALAEATELLRIHGMDPLPAPRSKESDEPPA